MPLMRGKYLARTICAGLLVALPACTPNPATAPPRPTTSAIPAAPSNTPSQAAIPTPSPTTGPSVSPVATIPASAAPPAPTQTPAPITGSLVAPGKNHSPAASAWAFPAKSVQFWMRNPGKGARPPKKTVFLTFDDGPSAMTPKMLDVLKRKGVHGTFFIVGNNVPRNGALVKRTIAEGHSVAIHSHTHNYGYLYPRRNASVANILADHKRADAAVKAVLGPSYFTSAYRYPGGHMSWRNMGPADNALAKLGVHWIDWNSMTGDAEPKTRRPTTVDGAVRLATDGLRAGADTVVVLMHDTGGAGISLQALPKVIDAYRAAGYSFGIIS